MTIELATKKATAPLEPCEDDEPDDPKPAKKELHHEPVESGYKASIDSTGSFDCQILGAAANGITAKEFGELFIGLVKELRPPSREAAQKNGREVQ